MVLDIPLISIVLGFAFLALIYAETRVKAKGIFAGISLIVNISAIIILFRFATELESILLFLLCEIAIVFALIFTQRNDNNVI